MDLRDLKEDVKDLDRRLERVDQILPTLATKEELREEGERTRRYMDAVVETAMRETRGHTDVAVETAMREMRGHTDAVVETAMRKTLDHMDAVVAAAMRETRVHFDVVAESILDKITLLAEGHAVLNGKHDSLKHETQGRLANHDLRITRLEAKRPRR